MSEFKPMVHVRPDDASTVALCGAGAPWPSSIAWERSDRPATCPTCLAKKEREERRLLAEWDALAETEETEQARSAELKRRWEPGT